LPKVFLLVLPFLGAVVSCRTTGTSHADGNAETAPDAFVQSSVEEIEQDTLANDRKAQALALESEWLKLRVLVVEAEKYACECLDSELKLAAQMAQFGSMDQRIPGEGFINSEQRVRWNAQLEGRKKARITAEARANLLRRDLEDLRVEIVKEGFSVPTGSLVY